MAGVQVDSGSESFACFGDESWLDLDTSDGAVGRQVLKRLLSPDFEDWSAAAARVGHCVRPIHLHGRSVTVSKATGEVLSVYSSDDAPLGTTLVRCGNRRGSVCPSCSRVYAGDMFHLIRSGVAGGKGVPSSVGENPLVFATLTAPSFGPVHGAREGSRRCRPRSRRERCKHGRALTCMASHANGDAVLGQPLCAECYDYRSHVVWQWWAPELWRRFTITLRRMLAARLGVLPSALGDHVTVQYAKVAEYQLRGVVHFHALIRLDGPRDDDGFATAPSVVDAALLASVVQEAAAAVRFTAPPVDEADEGRVLAFGAQVDTRAVSSACRTDEPGESLAAEQVAGYLAKYSTKAATDTVDVDGSNGHYARVQRTAREIARTAESNWATADYADTLADQPYGLLRKWSPSLGFRGHFASKSRRYSVTLGALRRARRRAQVLIADSRRTGRPLDLAAMEAELLADEEDETTLVIGEWAFGGIGWDNAGEAELARAAAARAREYEQFKAAANRTGGQRNRRVMSDETRVLSEDRLWTVEDVAYYLGVPVQTVYWWRGAGKGPPGRRVGKRVRYRAADVKAWFESLEVGVSA